MHGSTPTRTQVSASAVTSKCIRRFRIDPIVRANLEEFRWPVFGCPPRS
jgi:hypothetical protein